MINSRRVFVAANVCLFLSAAAATAAELKFEHVMNIGAEGTGAGQFKYVEDFAFSKDGHLLATDALHAFIQVFDKDTGRFIIRFGGKGEEEHNFDSRKTSLSIRTGTYSSPTMRAASSRSSTHPTSGC